MTFFDQNQFFRFIQDDTAGIYFYMNPALATGNLDLKAGKLVEIDGETSPGEYAPVVTVRQIKVLGKGTFPTAKPVSFEQVASGEEDSQFVEIHGIVRSVQWNEATKYFVMGIATGGGRLTALVAKLPIQQGEDLVDSMVRIRRGMHYAFQSATATVRHAAAGPAARRSGGRIASSRKIHLMLRLSPMEQLHCNLRHKVRMVTA